MAKIFVHDCKENEHKRGTLYNRLTYTHPVYTFWLKLWGRKKGIYKIQFISELHYHKTPVVDMELPTDTNHHLLTFITGFYKLELIYLIEPIFVCNRQFHDSK